jgi:hypothetical protein
LGPETVLGEFYQVAAQIIRSGSRVRDTVNSYDGAANVAEMGGQSLSDETRATRYHDGIIGRHQSTHTPITSGDPRRISASGIASAST